MKLSELKEQVQSLSELNNGLLSLTTKLTDCLASEKCNISKKKVNLSDLVIQNNASDSNGGCC